jgi:hypothetical protein
MAWARKPEEIREALEVQRSALTASCKAYDEGNRWEAIRLATTVFVIVHDAGKKFQSLLAQLGIRGKLRFVASGFPANPNNLLRETNLVMARVHSDGRAEYVPLLDEASVPIRRVQVHSWWKDDLILRDGTFRLTRQKLAFVLRSQEGGAHFDAALRDPNYVQFAHEQLSTPFALFEGRAPKPILGVEWASMRQVAWELLKTLEGV